MKTKPTTTTGVSGARKHDQPVENGAEQSDQIKRNRLNKPVTYPNLEEQVPDDCFTTQDAPTYGNNKHRSNSPP